MNTNLLISLIFFTFFIITVFILTIILFKLKRQKEDNLYNLLVELKSTFNDYKNQSQLQSKEVSIALENANKLAKTLTTNQNLKGQFGEECLEAILKIAYPEQNLNYFKQYNSQNEQGAVIKPDYLVKLPNNKSIFIDCKLNLEKFIQYQDNHDMQSKNELIKDLNSTINSLSKKAYETSINDNSFDFVLMYIPLEPLITLIYTDSDFISVVKNAYQKNIIIVGNSSILTTLRLTKGLWREFNQQENIKKIVDISSKIYDEISNHSTNLVKIKNMVDDFTVQFNKEYEKVSKENKIFKLANELNQLGVNSKLKKEKSKLIEAKIEEEFLK